MDIVVGGKVFTGERLPGFVLMGELRLATPHGAGPLVSPFMSAYLLSVLGRAVAVMPVPDTKMASAAELAAIGFSSLKAKRKPGEKKDPQKKPPQPVRPLPDTLLVFMKLEQVKTMTGYGKTKIYRLMSKGSFPQNVKQEDNGVAWIQSEVQEYLLNLVRGAGKTA
jgi:predicted DNA-binding transcriptional regulator AlpA